MEGMKPPRTLPRLPTTLVAVFISDESYAELRAQAIRYGFSNDTSQTARGMAAYVMAVFASNAPTLAPPSSPTGGFMDTRPDWMRVPEDYIVEGTASPPWPTWLDSDLWLQGRRSRRFVKGTIPIEAMHTLALAIGLRNPNRTHFQFNSPASSAGLVMECLAQRTLTPVHPPHNAAPVRATTPPKLWRSREVVW